MVENAGLTAKEVATALAGKMGEAAILLQYNPALPAQSYAYENV
jgi:hypothetical protein